MRANLARRVSIYSRCGGAPPLLASAHKKTRAGLGRGLFVFVSVYSDSNHASNSITQAAQVLTIAMKTRSFIRRALSFD
jgi:hypothetical protein